MLLLLLLLLLPLLEVVVVVVVVVGVLYVVGFCTSVRKIRRGPNGSAATKQTRDFPALGLHGAHFSRSMGRWFLGTVNQVLVDMSCCLHHFSKVFLSTGKVAGRLDTFDFEARFNSSTRYQQQVRWRQ